MRPCSACDNMPQSRRKRRKKARLLLREVGLVDYVFPFFTWSVGWDGLVSLHSIRGFFSRIRSTIVGLVFKREEGERERLDSSGSKKCFIDQSMTWIEVGNHVTSLSTDLRNPCEMEENRVISKKIWINPLLFKVHTLGSINSIIYFGLREYIWGSRSLLRYILCDTFNFCYVPSMNKTDDCPPLRRRRL